MVEVDKSGLQQYTFIPEELIQDTGEENKRNNARWKIRARHGPNPTQSFMFGSTKTRKRNSTDIFHPHLSEKANMME